MCPVARRPYVSLTCVAARLGPPSRATSLARRSSSRHLPRAPPPRAPLLLALPARAPLLFAAPPSRARPHFARLALARARRREPSSLEPGISLASPRERHTRSLQVGSRSRSSRPALSSRPPAADSLISDRPPRSLPRSCFSGPGPARSRLAPHPGVACPTHCRGSTRAAATSPHPPATRPPGASPSRLDAPPRSIAHAARRDLPEHHPSGSTPPRRASPRGSARPRRASPTRAVTTRLHPGPEAITVGGCSAL
jgi:hypothetical protein